MPEHKMLTINGVRVRTEDAHRYRPAAVPEPAPAAPAVPFDPASANADQVLTYLGTVGAAEAARVLDAEAAGKNRVGITNRREQLLAAAAERDGGTGGAAT
ncbi:hypothetical protein [Actinacidiphila epipremni]|uniref:Uncharacterized protein n=1 Tax=Actinacidiphila epipremni TaxID=2053013 RepID=A0ABX0ZG52_9ACTN|nr:hypothetical protein [Actinacidiphila epipremni]NJP42276.1 hypothetical protein [Actinacidiphila epipremni]